MSAEMVAELPVTSLSPKEAIWRTTNTRELVEAINQIAPDNSKNMMRALSTLSVFGVGRDFSYKEFSNFFKIPISRVDSIPTNEEVRTTFDLCLEYGFVDECFFKKRQDGRFVTSVGGTVRNVLFPRS